MKFVHEGVLAFILSLFRLVACAQSPGALDLEFNPRLTPESTSGPPDSVRSTSELSIYAIAVQDDGKILICGAFSAVNGVARNRITRLNPDGSLDASFNP